MYANPFCLTVTLGHTFRFQFAVSTVHSFRVTVSGGHTFEIRLSVLTEHKIPLTFGAWFSKLK